MKVRIDRSYSDVAEVRVYSTEQPDEVANFAMALIEKHAMIAGSDNGEDSAGRQKVRVQTPEELVERAFRVAELTYETAQRRGHMVQLPDLNEINAEVDAKRDKVHQKERDRASALES